MAREQARKAKDRGESEVNKAEQRMREGSRDAAQRGRDELAQIQKRVPKNIF